MMKDEQPSVLFSPDERGSVRPLSEVGPKSSANQQ